MAQNLTLHGIYAPLATPFHEDGSIAYEMLDSNLARWESVQLSGYVVGGSNGEFTSLTIEERVELVRFVRARTSLNRPVIAGSGMPSTIATIELGHAMADAGASALLVITPSYFKSKMGHQALVRFFNAIADASSLPVIMYNVPANTSVDMSAETILAAAEHPGIVAVKDSSGRVDKTGAVVHHAGDDFVVLAGSGGYMLGALAMGAVGAVAALANIAGQSLKDVMDAFESGDIELARRVQLRLVDLNSAVTVGFGVAGLKAAMDMLGYYGGPVRPPLLDLGESERTELRALLVKAGLL